VRPEIANQGQKGAKDRCDSALQAARRADADQLPHEESEIEAAGMDQHSLQDVRVATEVHAAHAAGLIEMGKGAFQALTAKPQ
jgi:hypothetical protein